MKLSEIEAYAYEAIYPDCDGELFFTLYLAKERASEVGGDIRKLHTPEQMQEYAKAKVAEALYKYTSFGTGKEELVKHMTEEFFAENIFEEDTKND